MTVSVGTGDIEYHPLYFSLGPLHNGVRQAHQNALIPIGFLAIPKSIYINIYILIQITLSIGDCKYNDNPKFRKFK